MSSPPRPARSWQLGAMAVASATMVACTGRLEGASVRLDFDAGTIASDAPSALVDAGLPPRSDAGSPAVDAGPPPVDAGPRDPYVCPYTDPMPTPIAGCAPPVMPSTGDPHEDCVRRINQFRCECQHLPPLLRWTDGEVCADMMAQYDHDRPGEAHAAFRARICDGGWGQNECPGWGSVESTISGCLQQMWDEGPGDFYGPPPHGHYLNMSSTSFSRVACGFYEGSSGVYALQNFQ